MRETRETQAVGTPRATLHYHSPPARIARQNLPVSDKSENGLACANAAIAGLQQPW
jgi:hypothetical protein